MPSLRPTSVLSAVLLLAAVTIAGQQTGWRVFTPPQGDISVLMPATPKRESSRVGELMQHVYAVKSGDGFYQLTLTELDPVDEDTWQAIRNGSDATARDVVAQMRKVFLQEMKDMGAQLLETTPTRSLNMVGHRYLFAAGEDTKRMLAITVTSRRRLYRLYCIVPKGQENSPRVRACLDSFRVSSRG